MQFNVSTLLQEPVGSRRHYTLRDEPCGALNDCSLVAGPPLVSGEVDLLCTDDSILARVALRLTVTERCGRCLRAIPLPLALRFEEEFWPPDDSIHHGPLFVPEGRDGFPIVEGILDLSEAVRQYAEMAWPMRALCGPDCPGPAAADAASPPAVEPAAEFDSRWQALQPLRRRLE